MAKAPKAMPEARRSALCAVGLGWLAVCMARAAGYYPAPGCVLCIFCPRALALGPNFLLAGWLAGEKQSNKQPAALCLMMRKQQRDRRVGIGIFRFGPIKY